MLETNELLKTKLSHSSRLHPLTDEELQQVQKSLLEIFLDIKKVCEDNSIPYTLGGGSVLGSVRHGGFIPWDDDIDVNVERKYLPVLKEKIEEAYGDKYYVQCPVESKEYYSTFWNVQKRGTVFRESLAQAEGYCGLKVDIFPVENTYKNPIARKFHGILSDGCSFILSCIRFANRKQEYMDLAEKNASAQRVIKIKAGIGKVFSISQMWWLKTANRVYNMCRNDHSDYVVVPSGRRHFFGEIYLRREFSVGRKSSFEGADVLIPVESEKYLERLYGTNYMTPPDEAHQEHHMVYELKL